MDKYKYFDEDAIERAVEKLNKWADDTRAKFEIIETAMAFTGHGRGVTVLVRYKEKATDDGWRPA